MSKRRRGSKAPPAAPSIARGGFGVPRVDQQAPDVRTIIREELAELTKTMALPAGTQSTSVSAAYLAQLNMRAGRPNPMAGLARDPLNNTSFGPGEPLYPSPLDPPLASGRPPPRLWEFPVSWNLQTTDTRMVPWRVLRDAADQVSIMRSCIETCKSAITGLDWSFGIDASRARVLAKRADTSSHAVIADLQDKFADDIDRLHQWWRKPDRINGWNFTDWIGALLEDQLVLDAVAVYPHLTLGGDLHSLELLDGSTIKPLLDHRGATPQPPFAAYQQILWGFPRSESSVPHPADQVAAEFVSAVYGRIEGPSAPTDSLIYKVRNRRTRGPYGFSCTERALIDVDLWLKRWEWLRAEYTAGVTPEMIIKVDAAMTPEQLRAYEAVYNDELSGRTNERHRARFLPDGFDPSYPQNFDSKFANDLDLHLIRLICAAFSVLPTSLGFTPNHGMGGMGGQGHQQGESDAQIERGTKPTAQWIVDLINEVSVNYLGMPPEVSFKFHGIDEDDETKSAALIEGYIGSALMTVNEGRDHLNMPRSVHPQANELLFKTPTGPAFLDPSVQPVGMPGNLPSAPWQGQPGAQQPPNQQQNQPAKKKPDTSSTSRDEQVQTNMPGDKKSEQKAFMMFIEKRGDRAWRDFMFNVHAPEVGKAANRLAAAGDVDAVKALFALTDDDIVT